MAAQRKSPNFEKALGELESLVTEMEEGNLSLADSLKAFEKGIKLTRSCQQALADAEQKVQLLLEESGEPVSVDFEDSDNS